jgi:hypothetical protein
MTDRELLQRMIDRIGKAPRAVEFDEETGRLVELNLAGLDLGEVPSEVSSFSHLLKLVLGETIHGLQKVVTNDGNVLWLCAEHARFHGL